MQRFIALTLALVLAGSAHAAGVFNGSADLTVSGDSYEIEYPVVMACVYKADNATGRGTLMALSDDGAGGSLDCLSLELRGDTTDRINAVSTAAGSSSAAATTVDSIATSDYRLAVALFENASSRRVMDTTTAGQGIRTWREETTERVVGNWSVLSIGSLHNGGGTNFFSGRIAQARVWFGADATAMIANPNDFTGSRLEYSNGSSTIARAIRPQLYLAQWLTRIENDFRDWGPEVTNNGVTFDFLFRR